MRGTLTNSHKLTFVVILSIFTVLTYLITDAGIDPGKEHNKRVVQTTLGTMTGPMTGAIARGFQGCCLKYSLFLMLFCAPMLSIGIGLQYVRLPDKKWVRVIRMFCWVLGWLIWFGGGIVSYGHALE